MVKPTLSSHCFPIFPSPASEENARFLSYAWHGDLTVSRQQADKKTTTPHVLKCIEHVRFYITVHITGFQINFPRHIWFHLQVVISHTCASSPVHLFNTLRQLVLGTQNGGVLCSRTPQNQTIHLYGALIVPSIIYGHLHTCPKCH